MIKSINYRQLRYIMGASSVEQLPCDEGVEIAFVGRSNVGKSSALNTLAEQGKLARVSKIPGRTQLINLFEFKHQKRLVDLPGYGYSQVPKKIKISWQKMLEFYLTKRKSLKGLILLIDSRHLVKKFDSMMIKLAFEHNLGLHILLTKADKLKSSEKIKTEHLFFDYLQKFCLQQNISFQFFSSHTCFGQDMLRKKLDYWYSNY